MDDDNDFYTVELDSDQKAYVHALLPQGYSLVRSSKIGKLIDTHTQTHTQKRALTQQAGFERANTTRDINDRLRRCESILILLMGHPLSDIFMMKVDHKSLCMHDYTAKIHEPIDLTSIRLKLLAKKYATSHDFVADVRKVFCNAYAYYPYRSTAYLVTVDVSEYFERLNNEILNAGYDIDDVISLNTKIRNLANKMKDITNQKAGQFKSVSDKAMTVDEKKELRWLISGM